MIRGRIKGIYVPDGAAGASQGLTGEGNAVRIVKGWCERAIQLLYPRRCPVCQEVVDPGDGLICRGCVAKLSPVRQPACKKCGKEVAGERLEVCHDCARHPRSFDLGLALLNYNETARRSIASIKYKNKREYLDFYAQALWRRFGKQIRMLGPDLWVPVPIHKSRRRQRGFNQAEELARRLSDISGIPMGTGLLLRVRKTSPQKDLSAAQRLENLKHAFAAGQAPPWVRSVVLVDDIYTTGSTAEACTRVLKRAGVSKVYVMSICIGQRQ